MEKINDGGPAFPYEHFREAPQSGMTLRDYFAAKAMHSLITKGALLLSIGPNDGNDNERVAICSYAMADAMLKAREVLS